MPVKMKSLSFFQRFECYRGTDATIIDVREPEELNSDGNIPGTLNIPKGVLEDALKMSPTQFEKVRTWTRSLKAVAGQS